MLTFYRNYLLHARCMLGTFRVYFAKLSPRGSKEFASLKVNCLTKETFRSTICLQELLDTDFSSVYRFVMGHRKRHCHVFFQNGAKTKNIAFSIFPTAPNKKFMFRTVLNRTIGIVSYSKI